MLLPDHKTRLALGGNLPYLVGCWSSRRGPVPNSGTVNDLSGHDNNIAFTGSSFWSAENGLELDNEFAAAIHSSSLSTTGIRGLTLLAWVYITNQSWLDRTGVFNKYNSGSGQRGYSLIIGKNNNANDFMLTFVCSSSGGSFVGIATEGSDVPVGQWTMVGATWTSGRQRLWVNGRLDAETTTGVATSINNSTDNLLFGTLRDEGSSNFSGYMNELMVIHNEATADQILALYESQRHLFGV